MTRFLTTSDVARICGMRADQVDDWTRRGWVQPVVPARGTGRHRLYLVPQALAIALGRYLRHERRIPLSVAGEIMAALHCQSETDLTMAFAAGRTHMAVVGVDATELIDPARVPMGARVVVDVAAAYRKILASIDAADDVVPVRMAMVN